MSLSKEEFLQSLQDVGSKLESALPRISSSQELEALRADLLGRKGELAKVMARLKELPEQDRPEAGQKANQVKKKLQELFQSKKQEIEQEKSSGQQSDFDPTLPGRRPRLGSLHPVTLVLHQICTVFTRLGFEIVTGPEVESDFYNFEALNIPKDHPARDMQDTLYIQGGTVLRTHTSPLQIRTMQNRRPPLAAVAPGKVYRRDADLTHSPMFHQIEGFVVDREVSMADLRGTLTLFVQQIFGSQCQVRFRPSYFPFTEPSAEVDISCVLCQGSGQSQGQPCRVCKQTGWVEILGCGMIDPEVFTAVDFDPEKYTGFAFGLGVERVAMLKYGIDDLRLFFNNDLRFLTQFRQLPSL
ncbi:MAG: phenylalanine--tRNA ligase subunit alpha [Thermodesulfobacteriota bacterium]